jgi:uncharacterized membrane protein YuzA (DUF378 family)
MKLSVKSKVFMKNVLNNIYGVSAEILVSIVFILIGFAVCVIWWSMIK